jgi:hypothetical protein
MKIVHASLVLLVFLPLSTLGQGNLAFNNGDVTPGPAPVTISSAPGTFNPADGSGGAYVGGDYTASLYFLNGIVTNQAVFDSSNPILSALFNTPFLGVTGVGPNHGPTTDGAGLFGANQNYLGAATGQVVTIQVRAWYNGDGLYTSYDQALAAGQNVGEANPVSLFLAVGAGALPNLDGLLPFTVRVVPEPSVYALLGLGGLLLFRRRKTALRS